MGNGALTGPTVRKPRVAVVGASNDQRKFGNRAVRAFRAEGYDVVPVNLHEATVEGLPAYRSVLDVPGPLDMISVYLPPEIGIGLLGEFAATGAREVWFNPGSESPALLDEAARRGLNVVAACSIVGAGRNPADF